MTDWQSYLDIIREEDTPPLSSHRLLATTTATETDRATSSPSSADEQILSVEMAARSETQAQRAQAAISLPTWAEPGRKVGAKGAQRGRKAPGPLDRRRERWAGHCLP